MPQETHIPPQRCALCDTPRAEGAHFCSQCGKPFGATTPQAPPPIKWYYNVWFVLVMLFLVLGPFGLPLVWKNPRFSRTMKLVLSLVVGLYTVWLIEMTIQASRLAIQHLQQLNSSFQF